MTTSLKLREHTSSRKYARNEHTQEVRGLATVRAVKLNIKKGLRKECPSIHRTSASNCHNFYFLVSEHRAPFVDAATAASVVTFVLSRITTDNRVRRRDHAVQRRHRNAWGDELESAPNARPSYHQATDEKNALKVRNTHDHQTGYRVYKQLVVSTVNNVRSVV